MPSVDATVGGATANAYQDEAAVTALLDERLNAEAWLDEVDADRQTRACITATRILELLRWSGSRVDDVQSLSFPRAWLVNPDIPSTALGPYYPEDEIPGRILRAHALLCLELLRLGAVDLTATPRDAGVKRKKVDILETEWFGPDSVPRGLDRYPEVTSEIEPLLASGAGVLQVVRT